MAENTTLNPGVGGDVIATEDFSTYKIQRVKMAFGAKDTLDQNVSAANPLPIYNAIALPAGTNVIGALVAHQSVNVDQIGGSALALGQAVMASSIPVAIASNQSTLNVQLQTGANVIGSLAAHQSANIDQIGGATFGLGQAVMNLSLPVVLASNQSAIPNNLSQIGGSPVTLGQNTMANSMSVAIASNQSTLNVQLQTGANVIGSLAANQSTNIAQFGGTGVTLGQKVMGSSIPVVLASDQGIIAAVSYGTYNTTPPTLLNAGIASMQFDVNANIKMVLAAAIPAGSNVIGALVANQSINVTQIGGAALALGQAVMANSIPVVLASNQSAIPVTANAGTNLNTSALALESGGNLAAIATSVSGLSLAQGAATSGQKGMLNLGAVTTAAPAYTTAQSSPLSLTLAGGLRVDLASVGGASFALGQNNMASSISVAIASNQSTLNVQLQTGANVIGSLTANQSVNLTQIGGAALAFGQAVMASSIPVVLSSNQSAIPVTQSGAWTVTANAGTNLNTSALALETGGNLAAIATSVSGLSLAQGAATSGQKGILGLGAVTTAAPAYTTAQSSPLSLTLAGGLRSDIASVGGAAMTLGQKTMANSFPVVIGSDQSAVAVTQSGAWTVTANAGTNLNTSLLALEAGGNLAAIATSVSGLSLAQGAATSGQKGMLGLGAVTTAAPAYTTAQSSPLSLTLAGGLRIDVASVGAAAISLGQKTMANSFPVVIASDQSAILVSGDVASGNSDAGNPLKIGGLAKTANPTAVADGQRVNAMFDKVGRQLVVSGQVRQLITTKNTQIVNSAAETTILTAVAAIFLDLVALVVSNQSATAVNVTIKDATAGTTRMVFTLSGNAGIVIMLPRPHPQAAVNNNWTATLSVATVTVNFFAMAEQNI